MMEYVNMNDKTENIMDDILKDSDSDKGNEILQDNKNTIEAHEYLNKLLSLKNLEKKKRSGNIYTTQIG